MSENIPEVKISRTAETILGILGGTFGLMGAIVVLFFGGLGSVFGAEGASQAITVGLVALFLAVLGIVGGAIASRKAKIAGILMLLSGIGGFIAIFIAYIIAGLLLIIGGILALTRKSELRKNYLSENMGNENEIKPKKKSRKWLWIILGIFFFIIIIAIAGSGGEKKSSVSTSEEASTVYSINQDVRVSDVRWKLLDVKDRGSILRATESRYPTFAEDKITTGKFIEITMEVENLGTEMKTVSNLKLVDNKGREFISASDVSKWISEKKELFLLSNLNPNMPQQFTDMYEIPADATELKVKVGDLSFRGKEEALISLGL